MSLLTLFRKVGFIVGKRPKTIFLINLFLFLPSLTFYLIYDIKVETDVRRGFSPKNGRATKEMEAFSEFYNVSIDGLDLLLIFLESKTSDKRLIINDKLLSEVDFMDNYIKELSLEINDEGSSDQKISNNKSQVVRLKDFQTSRGDMNYLFHAFKWAYQLQSTSLLFTSKLIKQINLDFPISHIYGFDVLLDSHFYGVKLRESNQSQMFASKIESVETIGIFYLLDGDKNKNQMEILNKLEVKLFNDINTGKLNNLTFKVLIYADQLANHEMMRGSKKITSLLGIGVAAMILFLIVAFWHFNWKSQFILITSSLLSPLLSISVAFSIIGWIGIKFNSIMPIMPFLVFGIGVDNAFLLIHSWRKWALIEQKELNENKENDQKKDIFPQRMANVFEEMGSSIAITSLTNGIAFGIGIFSPSSLMSNFCLCTSIAIFLDFLFEFLIFAPCLPLIKWKIEENGEEINEIKNEKKEIIFSIKKENWPLFGKIKSKKESYSSFSSSFLRFYSKFLVSFRAKIFMFVLLFFSYILAFFGINQMETSFVPERTFPGDSPLQNTIKIFNRIMKEHSPISFFVFHPPNISDPVELSDFNRMITILQNLPNTLHVQIWLNGYLEYHKNKINLNNSINYHPSYSLVPQFLNERRMADKRIVQFKDYGLGNISVESFVFGISRGGNLNWLERAFFVDKIRHIVDQFPKFNVTVFDYDSTIYDLILGVKTEMLKAVFVTLTCMALICFFVIPTLRCTGIATFSVFSISYTLLGTLGWCGQEIDPVTMINILMAIGLSVDFSAHICYHFYILGQKEIQTDSPIKNKFSDQKEMEKRIKEILLVVGRPMLEAVISTIICIFPLFFISIEIIVSFARTILFLGLIGIIHGLFIVPVLLTIQINGLKKKKAGRFSEGNLQNN